jgi:hypothetical protein
MGQFDELANELLTGIATDLGAAGSATYIVVTSTYDETTSETSEDREEVEVLGVLFYSDRKALALHSRLAARGSVDTVESNLPTLTALVPGVQLAGVTPKVNDVIKRGTDEHTIESVSIDPVGAAYIFGLRLP